MQLVETDPAILGEGPLWDDQAQVLWWIDIIGRRLRRFDPSNGSNQTFELPEKPGTVVLGTDGLLGLAMQTGFYSFDPATEHLIQIADPDSHEPETRFNDGKCDPKGRFWAGSMEDKETGKLIGSLYSLSDGVCTKHFGGIGVSNGIVWNSSADTMYYIDSPTRKVDAFDYDLTTGAVSNRRTVINVPDGLGYPDGMSIDVNDKLWVCMWHGWAVIQFDPESGEIMQKLDVPVRNVTACAFAGPDLQELYITTSRHGNDDVGLDDQLDAGGLFHTRVNVQGTGFARFAG
ncbi:MAG TPA: SMP-30/gluconolaconase/LRE domain protein [Planctomycetaceae bacterium]|nr:SMP-30/gluconolaconase/LRE domain protein [Planctomycetaceae bacterium]|tara:strand:- start:147 stop:1013 length:867 start_codon:yes stop_codon:yes gene_type:complete